VAVVIKKSSHRVGGTIGYGIGFVNSKPLFRRLKTAGKSGNDNGDVIVIAVHFARVRRLP
jgi:hypothetical protein